MRSVCEAIWDCLSGEFLAFPTEAEWRKIAEDFARMWAFPNCVGAMDGKHVVIEAPPLSGSLYFNYKKSFSIVLLAVVDAHYRFRVVDIGAYGKNSDGGTLAASAFGSALRQVTLNLPGDAPLPGAENLGPIPHVFLADEAFPLRRNLLRPYPGHTHGEKRVFNYRLSRQENGGVYLRHPCGPMEDIPEGAWCVTTGSRVSCQGNVYTTQLSAMGGCYRGTDWSSRTICWNEKYWQGWQQQRQQRGHYCEDQLHNLFFI